MSRKDDSAVIFQKIKSPRYAPLPRSSGRWGLKASRLFSAVSEYPASGGRWLSCPQASLIKFFQDQHDIISADKIIPRPCFFLLDPSSSGSLPLLQSQSSAAILLILSVPSICIRIFVASLSLTIIIKGQYLSVKFMARLQFLKDSVSAGSHFLRNFYLFLQGRSSPAQTRRISSAMITSFIMLARGHACPRLWKTRLFALKPNSATQIFPVWTQ